MALNYPFMLVIAIFLPFPAADLPLEELSMHKWTIISNVQLEVRKLQLKKIRKNRNKTNL
jgi:hypothetical protein